MSPAPIKVTPLTTAIGAEISGVDLGKPLDAATEHAICQTLIDHLVIFFRDQDIAPERRLASARSLGDRDESHPICKSVQGFDRIVMQANDASNPPDTDGWHTDLTVKKNPPFASTFVARDVPPVGGDTICSSMYAAYDALPQGKKSAAA